MRKSSTSSSRRSPSLMAFLSAACTGTEQTAATNRANGNVPVRITPAVRFMAGSLLLRLRIVAKYSNQVVYRRHLDRLGLKRGVPKDIAHRRRKLNQQMLQFRIIVIRMQGERSLGPRVLRLL